MIRVMFRSIVVICTIIPITAEPNCGDIGFSNYNEVRVASFFEKYTEKTSLFSRFLGTRDERASVLDERLKEAKLPLADKIELLKRLSPPNTPTTDSKEIRMERLILSVDPHDLSTLKCSVDYDGDDKDMAEYVFHDIDEKDYQETLVEHFTQSTITQGIKVLSDVDDTLYANLVDDRYPKGAFYPGVLAFYAALVREPCFHQGIIPITTLSARPNPPGTFGFLEKSSIKGLIEKSNQKLCPTALSGAIISSTIGTAETVARVNTAVIRIIETRDRHDYEDEIGEVKFANFAAYSQLYPNYRFVFVGDSGQADSITATKMVSDKGVAGTNRVLTTFIHDLRSGPEDTKLASNSFRNMDSQLKVTANSERSKGVIVFRNYIAAAMVAYTHSDKLEHLITSEELGKITLEALVQFSNIDFDNKTTVQKQLIHEYRDDAKIALTLLRSNNDAGLTSLLKDIEIALAKL